MKNNFKTHSTIIGLLSAALLMAIFYAGPCSAAQEPFWRGMDEATLLKMVGTDKFAFIDRTSGSERAVVAMVVDVAPGAVWGVITDFEHYTDYLRECSSVKVKNETDKSATVYFKMTLLKAGPVNLASEYTLAYKMDKSKRMEFSSVGDNGKILNGAWELVPVQGGKRTVLFYDAYSDFKSAGSLAKYMVDRSPSLEIAVNLANAMVYVEQIKRAAEKKGR